MNLLLSLLSSLLPTGVWLWVFLRRDHEPEPAWLLLRTFAWGMFAWLVSATFGVSLGALGPVLVLLLGALTEEGSKLLAAATTLHEPDFDEPMDGLIYAVTAALGFALPENVSYGLGYGASAALWHGLITTLAHALFSAPIGYALTQARLRPAQARHWLLRGLGISVALHLSFNSLLSSGVQSGVQLLGLGAVLVLMWLLAGRYYGQFDNRHKRQPR
ncbi:PrsW family intramembrane metalloprotease [Deinococcus sonorensis]|uniref:Protease PrsW n=2 Tax=Deinococcus sonorensis TaxID=309891 RepID=A0AAU7UD60_9DEIO